MKLFTISQSDESKTFGNLLLDHIAKEIQQTGEGFIDAEWEDMSFDHQYGTKELYGWTLEGEVTFTVEIPSLMFYFINKQDKIEESISDSSVSASDIVRDAILDSVELQQWLNDRFVDEDYITSGAEFEPTVRAEITELTPLNIIVKGSYSIVDKSGISSHNWYQDTMKERNLDI